MKLIILFFISISILFSCTMDCKSCHPKFNIEQIEHKPLKVCATCHTTESLANVEMGNACGADCFSCHPIEKLNNLGIQEHTIMNTCIECHNKDNFVPQKLLKLDNSTNLKELFK